MGTRPCTIVPILVGSTSAVKEELYGKLLAPFLNDPGNFFIVSSDFCHWGSRFRYTPHDTTLPIHEYITSLDERGMDIISAQDYQGFRTYVHETNNTICGQHPIGIFLQIMFFSEMQYDVQFVHYAQSSACTSMEDSSVSYAAAIVTKKA